MTTPTVITIELPHVVTVPLGERCHRATSIDATHIRGTAPKIEVGGTKMSLVEVEHVALTMLHMVRTHPDGPGVLVSETRKRPARARR